MRGYIRTTVRSLIGLALVCGPQLARAQASADSLKALAQDAYVYAFPVVTAYRTLFAVAVGARAEGEGTRFNRFAHRMSLAGPASRVVVLPNNDTFYSPAWLDLRAGPVVLTVPEAPAGRYRSLQVVDLFTNNVAVVSGADQRGGRFLVAGPMWQGEPPAGTSSVIRVKSDFAFALGRTAVYGGADSATAAALAAAFSVEPSATVGGAPGSRDAGSEFPQYDEDSAASGGFVRYLNFALAHSQLEPAEETLIRRMQPLGVGTASATQARRSGAERQAIDEGVSDARQLIRASRGLLGERRGSWIMVDAFGDSAGRQGRYLVRAAAAWHILYGLPRREAVYFSSSSDSEGRPLDGNAPGYVLRFAPSQMPPAKAFWSVTMYDDEGYLVANAKRRYSIGDRTAGVQRDTDGALTIYIQRASPGVAQKSNWLPAPAGPFTVTLRLYLPDETRIGTYTPPPLRPAR